MITEQATEILGKILHHGDNLDETDIANLCGWWDREKQRFTRKGARRRAEHVKTFMCAATQNSKNARWRQAEANLDWAYWTLGAENPDSGYAFYAGTHPIWAASVAAKQEEIQ
jgi:hypothetical protein